MSATRTDLPRQAEALGLRLPALLVAAERVAATVAQGVHGRRRVGRGDSFWQYRPYVPGDPLARVDWRQSAKSDRAYVRDTEWEAAQTVCLWRDGSPSMRWASTPGSPTKCERAELLLLALASLLLRGGERVRLIGTDSARALAGRGGLQAIAAALLLAAQRDERAEEANSDKGERGHTPASHAGAGGGQRSSPSAGLPPSVGLPAQARVVLIGDFLAPLPEIQATLAGFAAIPVRAHLLQVLDPAELALPYAGRVRFRGLEREPEVLVPRVEAVRAAYAEALSAQQAGLAAMCRAAGFGFAVHRTDHRPEVALLALYAALAPAPGGGIRPAVPAVQPDAADVDRGRLG